VLFSFPEKPCFLYRITIAVIDESRDYGRVATRRSAAFLSFYKPITIVEIAKNRDYNGCRFAAVTM